MMDKSIPEPDDLTAVWLAAKAEDAATIAALRAEVDRLRDALFEMIRTLDECGRIERGAGGMTIEAQIRRTEINRVPAWAVEEARAALGDAS